MATINDTRNIEKSSVAGPALEDFSTRAKSMVEWTEYVEDR